MADFRDHLTERFAILKPRDSLQLTVDAYALLPDAALTILRDGDLISVAVTAPALPAVVKGRRKRALPDAELEQPVKKRRTAAKAALEAPLLLAAATPGGPSEQASSSSEASSLAHGVCRPVLALRRWRRCAEAGGHTESEPQRATEGHQEAAAAGRRAASQGPEQWQAVGAADGCRGGGSSGPQQVHCCSVGGACVGCTRWYSQLSEAHPL